MKPISTQLLKIKTFLKSLFFHVWAGFPKTSQQEIEHRWQICISCDQFDQINTQCGICGCNLSRKKEFMNKLAWADQECPIGKWKKYGK
jgi:uncharacterized paraquat-inducible protein A